MNGDHYRFFIVLPTGTPGNGPALLERPARRAAALNFVASLKEWIAENKLQDQVSNLDVTMFGQVQITCALEFIEQIRQQDMLAISEIRPAQSMDKTLHRLLEQISG
jgi:hypothetical protein